MRLKQITLFKFFILLMLIHGFGTNLRAEILEERITNILDQMTIAEKIEQLHKEGGFKLGNGLRQGI